MASISTCKKNGTRSIEFTRADGKRKRVRLGKMPLKDAKTACHHIEVLNYAKCQGTVPDLRTAEWLDGLGDVLRNRLAAVGLTTRRESALLGSFIDGYIKTRSDTKESTSTVYGHTRRCLVDHFGAEKPLRDITPGHADEWRIWLADHEELAANTVRRRCGIAKQFFRAALRKGLIRSNPFSDLKAAVQGNSDRQRFITRAEADAVLNACPDEQWRLIFALSRYGGLRCPSEHLALTWGDVDWDGNRLRLSSPKTEHHEGKASRVIPLFPEIERELSAAWDLLPPKTPAETPIITRYRSASQNLRTTFEKIVRRAGLEPWPKLFHNLRATRETELAETYPMHVVCEWIGNSAVVAAKHYLQITDEHFATAVQPEAARNGRSTEP